MHLRVEGRRWCSNTASARLPSGETVTQVDRTVKRGYGPVMDQTKIRNGLDKLGAERQALDGEDAALKAKRHKLNLKLANFAPVAEQAGISKTEIAQRTGISRQSLYAILDD
jgi:hypothetical protein